MQNSSLASRAKQVFILIVFAGGMLATCVYELAASVERQASQYMESDLAVFSEVQRLSMLLSEQERILYEYYATSSQKLYLEDYTDNIRALNASLTEVKIYGVNPLVSEEIAAILDDSSKVAGQLDENLASEWTDWDDAREQLEKITAYRQRALPLLDSIINDTNQSVAQGYQSIIRLLQTTVWTVGLFAAGIALISIYLGRYASRYIQLSTENETLALFPKRNPNPVIRLDANWQLLYANPAAESLVEVLYPGGKNAKAHLPANMKQILRDSGQESDACAQTTLFLNQRYYAVQSHWIAEHQTYDMHINDITQRYQAEQALEHQAYHHAVTGIGNRSYLEKYAAQWIDEQSAFHAVMIDVSEFKMLSENFGLADALACVYSVGEFINVSLEKYKAENQWDDELKLFHVADACFMLLLKKQAKRNALSQLIQYIRNCLQKSIETPLGDMRFQVTLGVSGFPDNSQDYQSLLLHTNIAVEQAHKNNAMIHYFNVDDGAHHQRRMHITRRLEQALAAGELSLYYQPKQHLGNGNVRSCECLLRWFDDGEFISPAEFIPLAERSGLILPLGEWVLDNAFQQVKTWLQQGLRIQVAINISARQFLQPGFSESIAKRLQEYGVPSDLIELELTETSIMDNHQLASEVLLSLRQLGVSLSIDDFGTGYSSLAYLSAFPVDKVKIDRSFVSQMVDAPKQQAIVLTICQLAHNLGLQVVAEGVETDAQRLLLQQYGCDYLQGYWLAKPVPAVEATGHFTV